MNTRGCLHPPLEWVIRSGVRPRRGLVIDREFAPRPGLSEHEHAIQSVKV